MPINESTRVFLEQTTALGIKPFHRYSPEECRTLFAQLNRSFGAGPQVGHVGEHRIAVQGAAIGLRLFQPDLSPRGLIFHCHGGGWLMGNLDDYDAFARRLVAATGWAVALVDYRLAPEHAFPIPLEDCWSALLWSAEQAERWVGSGLPLTVAGDSAGGNLAAVLAQRSRDRGGPRIAAQVLIYPAVQAQRVYRSQTDPSCQLLLTQADMDWFWDHYAPDKEARLSTEASPLLATNLTALPATLLITAGADPLHDEGVAYAERLRDASTAVVHREYAEDMHGFVTLPPLTSGQAALQDIASFLNS